MYHNAGPIMYYDLVYHDVVLLDLHSFPTRRSSDLTWPSGVELSFGQWQKLALARGFMRDRPLLLVLDEPTAALDAETDRKSTRLNSSHSSISYAVFCLKKKK